MKELNREQRRLAIGGRWLILGYVSLITVSFVVIDVWFSESSVIEVWASLFGWAAGYLLLVGLMDKGGYFADGKAGGVGTYFVLGLAMGIPIGLAMIVFILPGLYLLMRWLPAYARALTSEDWIGNTMRWSWVATQPHQKPLAIAMIGPVVCYSVTIAPYFAYELLEFVPYEIWSVVMNAAASVASAWLTVLGIAALGVIKSGQQEFAATTGTKEPA